MSMLLVILAWVCVLAVLIVFILRQARRDSHSSDFLYTMENENVNGNRKPRVVGTHIAFTPSGKRGDSAAGAGEDSTSETPVYVNDSTVLEVRTLRDAGDADDASDAEQQDGDEAGTAGAKDAKPAK
ncbi:hypothetical protein KIH77_06215 [Bifidobacterium sp. 82T24]|uniref:hypothetical protein n=1 Tax=Bifidobacterium pluvialisilvae TaxID=2834436 RepID=UPI001C58BE17|nr:hypothetical protein [Bifidobacterium pluvialisilvae]MBW3088322.1 hypothetical protein [Bifidobacterium pluvialisilvae]